MQEIERYGLITLVFLVVSAIAVALWDGKELAGVGGDGTAVASAEPSAARNAQEDHRGQGDQRRRESERLTQNAPIAGANPQGRPSDRTLANARLGVGGESASAGGGGAERGPGRGAPADPRGNVQPRNGGVDPARDGARDADLALAETTQRANAADLRGQLPASPVGNGVVEPQGATSQPESGAERRGDDRTASAPREVALPEGETLSHLAQRYLGSANRWETILAANPGLDPNRITAGTMIKLPAEATLAPGEPSGVASAEGSTAGRSSGDTGAGTRGEGAARANAPVAGGPSTPSNARAYVVARGESAWSIAERELGSGARYTELAALNPGTNLASLTEGATLFLPVGGPIASATPKRRSGVR